MNRCTIAITANVLAISFLFSLSLSPSLPLAVYYWHLNLNALLDSDFTAQLGLWSLLHFELNAECSVSLALSVRLWFVHSRSFLLSPSLSLSFLFFVRLLHRFWFFVYLPYLVPFISLSLSFSYSCVDTDLFDVWSSNSLLFFFTLYCLFFSLSPSSFLWSHCSFICMYFSSFSFESILARFCCFPIFSFSPTPSLSLSLPRRLFWFFIFLSLFQFLVLCTIQSYFLSCVYK